MIKIENTNVWGFEGAIRGMRNPYESHEKSDSVNCYYDHLACQGCERLLETEGSCTASGHFYIGKADMTLAKKLIKGGSEHRKFLRMIHVQAEVLAPRYWWAEMDKYKYVEANSSSTMHLITKRHLTMDDFSLRDKHYGKFYEWIDVINYWIDVYNSDDFKKYADVEGKNGMLAVIKSLLPESYNQLRMIDTNYECLLNIYRQRKNHRLTEWHDFCSWVESLPYMKDFLEATK